MLGRLRNKSGFGTLMLLALAATLMFSFSGCTLAANNSLRALRQKRGIPVGTAVTTQALPNDATYRTVLAREFNIMTPENEMKFQWVHPEPDRYDFTAADAIVKFAKETAKRNCC